MDAFALIYLRNHSIRLRNYIYSEPPAFCTCEGYIGCKTCELQWKAERERSANRIRFEGLFALIWSNSPIAKIFQCKSAQCAPRPNICGKCCGASLVL